MSDENAWRNEFVAAMRRTRATNDEINAELVKAYDAADREGKTPKGALGAPTEYAATLGYRPRIANLVELMAGAVFVLGAFMLYDALTASRRGQPYVFAAADFAWLILVVAGIPTLLWAYQRYSTPLVVMAALALIVVCLFFSIARTAPLFEVAPAVPMVLGVLLALAACGFVWRYLSYHNAHPVRDPLTDEDVRFANPNPSFMQQWGALVWMLAALACVGLLAVL